MKPDTKLWQIWIEKEYADRKNDAYNRALIQFEKLSDKEKARIFHILCNKELRRQLTNNLFNIKKEATDKIFNAKKEVAHPELNLKEAKTQ